MKRRMDSLKTLFTAQVGAAFPCAENRLASKGEAVPFFGRVRCRLTNVAKSVKEEKSQPNKALPCGNLRLETASTPATRRGLATSVPYLQGTPKETSVPRASGGGDGVAEGWRRGELSPYADRGGEETALMRKGEILEG